MLTIAIPNKGRLRENTVNLLNRIGLKVSSHRALLHALPGEKYTILSARAQDIPEYVELGAADVGITGLDVVEEDGRSVNRLLDLNFGRCSLVVAAPDNSGIKTVEDIPDAIAVGTSFPNLTKAYFERIGRTVNVVPVSGATEVTPAIGVADIITDLTETGSTLRQNKLHIISTILDSHVVLIGNASQIDKKADEVTELTEALKSVLAAATKRYLMANVPREQLAAARDTLPGISGPTIMNLSGTDDVVAVHAVVDEQEINSLIPRLKAIGAEGILILPIERMVP